MEVASTMLQVMPSTPSPGYGWPFQCVEVGTAIAGPVLQATDENGIPQLTVSLGYTYTPRFWPIAGNVASFFVLCILAVRLKGVAWRTTVGSEP